MKKQDNVSKEQLQAWRRQYEALFQLSDGETDYYVRPLTFAEHEEARALGDRGLNAMAEEYVLLQAVVYPEIDSEAIDDMPAGIARMVEEILNLSAFVDVEESSRILQQARSDVHNDLWSAAAAFIIIAIPSLDLEDLRHMGMRRLMEHVALAEQIFQLDHKLRQGDTPTLTLHKPGEEPDDDQMFREQGQTPPKQRPSPHQQQRPPQSQNPEEQQVLDEMRAKMREAEQYL